MASSRKHGYIRISSTDQNEARQTDALKAFGINDRDIYIDKQSGKDFDRPEYQRMINNIREGDLVTVLSIDRLGRNYTEIQEQWRHITQELNADIKVLDMPLLDTTVHPDTIDGRFVADLVLQILSYVADKERQNIHARQAQGIAAARARGDVKFGRPTMQFPDNWNEVYAAWHDRKEITAKKAIEELNMKRSTFYKLVKRYEAAN